MAMARSCLLLKVSLTSAGQSSSLYMCLSACLLAGASCLTCRSIPHYRFFLSHWMQQLNAYSCPGVHVWQVIITHCSSSPKQLIATAHCHCSPSQLTAQTHRPGPPPGWSLSLAKIARRLPGHALWRARSQNKPELKRHIMAC
jgi:hypothetical protein